MDYATIKNIHIVLVALFVVTYLIKAALLLTNRFADLDNYRQRTLIPEMVLATLFLLTGFYLLFTVGMSNFGGWLHLKLALVILAIPLGMIGYKRKNKALGLLATLIFLYVFGLAWTERITVF